MYEVRSWLQDIHAVEVERETEHTVWIKTSYGLTRRAKDGVFFATWQAAHDAMLAVAREKVRVASVNLDHYKADLAAIEAMEALHD